MWSFATRWALVPLESVAIPMTVLASLSLRQYKQLSSGLHTLSSQFYSPAHACALFCICRAYLNHIEHVTLAYHSYPGETISITVVAERRPLAEGRSVH